MAKFCLKKPSKRMQARKRYKIEKKVREHNRKKRKEAKLNSKKKPKLIHVPNECPFKEDIIREVEAAKKQKEEEKLKLREEAKQRKKEARENGSETLDTKIESTETQENLSLPLASESKDSRGLVKNNYNFLKPHYRDCKRVLDLANVVLEILDARDPLGTKCQQVEDFVIQNNKRLIIVLNKADLVPKENLEEWLKYFQKNFPTIAVRSLIFKEIIKGKSKKKKRLLHNNDDVISGDSIGYNVLFALLNNCYKNTKQKKSMTVSVVGVPNVGKSSVINSLKRSKVCNVGNNPGTTKLVQNVQLNSKIKLLDSPGIEFDDLKEAPIKPQTVLKHVVKTELIKDFFNPVTDILKSLNNNFGIEQIMEMYDVKHFKTNEEFFEQLAVRNGQFKKGRVPDIAAAARIVLNDWTSGKIRFHTLPPEKSLSTMSAKVISEMAKDFQLDLLASEEEKVLEAISAKNVKSKAKSFIIESSGPVNARILIEQEKKEKREPKRKLKSDQEGITAKKSKKEQIKLSNIQVEKAESDDYNFETDYIL